MDAIAVTTVRCRVCKKNLPSYNFGTRKFRGVIVPVQACFQCAANVNKLARASTKTPKARASRAKVMEMYQKTDGYHASMKRFRKSDKAKVIRKRHAKTEKGKQSQKRHKESDKCTQTTAAYKASDRYKEVRAAEYRRTHSDPGRHLEHAIGVVMGHMLGGERNASQKIVEASGFADADALWKHLQSTFEDGMTLENHGRYVKGGPRVWHIGHRIARKHFDPKMHPEDMKRCWSPANLFAQWADENMAAGTKLPDHPTLLLLKNCWPMGWGGELPGWV